MSDARRAELAKIHIAKKQLGLDDDAYRDLLEAITKQRSAAKLTAAQRQAVLEEFKKRGFRDSRSPRSAPARAKAKTLAVGPEFSKIRALWLSLYHLGEVRDSSEGAILAFAQSTKIGAEVDALQWLDGEDRDKLIKALKGWCARVGFEQSTADYRKSIERRREHAQLEPLRTGFADKVLLIELLWTRLGEAGAYDPARNTGLGAFLFRHYGVQAAFFLPDGAKADEVIERLGRWLRKTHASADVSRETADG